MTRRHRAPCRGLNAPWGGLLLDGASSRQLA